MPSLFLNICKIHDKIDRFSEYFSLYTSAVIGFNVKDSITLLENLSTHNFEFSAGYSYHSTIYSCSSSN